MDKKSKVQGILLALAVAGLVTGLVMTAREVRPRTADRTPTMTDPSTSSPQPASAQQPETAEPQRGRLRDFGITIGVLPTGEHNAITDVAGVKVGQVTLIEGDAVRTGVTAILPHDGNVFQEKVPAAVFAANGFGKMAGIAQIQELGNMETPIVLTNTLNVAAGLDGLITHTLNQPGNEDVRSLNAVVGETNDGRLNDIRGRHVKPEHVLEALAKASSGPVSEGNVGAGTGTMCFYHKGGIGTSSRKIPEDRGGYTVGVLVQANFGGVLTVAGAPVGERLGRYFLSDELGGSPDGSIMIVVATDAPLSARSLERLARRAFLGIGRTGGIASNGSGDFIIAFSTDPRVRIPHSPEHPELPRVDLENAATSPLFLAAIEATEEAILNAVFMAETMTGRDGNTVDALPLGKTLEILREHGMVK